MQQKAPDWGAARTLSERHLAYAANDVTYLHELKKALDAMLAREGRIHLAKACFDFPPPRAELDVWAAGKKSTSFAH